MRPREAGLLRAPGTENDLDAGAPEHLGCSLYVVDPELGHRPGREVPVQGGTEHLRDATVGQAEGPHVVPAVDRFEPQDVLEERGHGLGPVGPGPDEPDRAHPHAFASSVSRDQASSGERPSNVVTIRSASDRSSPAVASFGTQRQGRPAALAARIPFGESSITSAWDAGTSSSSRAASYRCGFGLARAASPSAQTIAAQPSGHPSRSRFVTSHSLRPLVTSARWTPAPSRRWRSASTPGRSGTSRAASRIRSSVRSRTDRTSSPSTSPASDAYGSNPPKVPIAADHVCSVSSWPCSAYR